MSYIEKQRTISRQYYYDNKEKVLKRASKYYQENKARISDYNHEYYMKRKLKKQQEEINENKDLNNIKKPKKPKKQEPRTKIDISFNSTIDPF